MSKKDAVVKNDPKSQEKWYNNTHIYVYTNTYTYIYEQGHLGLKLVVKFSKDVFFFFLNRAEFFCILKPPPWSNTVRNEWITQFCIQFFSL